jgi:endo-1,4-beta-xylanase
VEAAAKAQEKIDLADAAQISSRARGYVSLAATIGLLEGYPDKTFMPKKNTTRAEAVILICRFLEKSKL